MKNIERIYRRRGKNKHVRYVFNIPFYFGRLSDLDRALELLATSQKSNYIACMNPHSYVMYRLYPDFRHAISSASLCVCDGVGMYIAVLLRFRRAVVSRITGRQVLSKCISLNKKLKARSIIVSPNVQSGKDLVTFFAENDLDVDLCYQPEFSERIRASTLIDQIHKLELAESHAFIYIFIGAPKQEALAYSLTRALSKKTIICVGGVYDELLPSTQSDRSCFSVSLKKLSSKLYMEWLFRFLKEPKRMWKRLIISTTVFICILMFGAFTLPIKSLLRYLLAP